MNTKCQFIKHELLNLFTVMSHLLTEMKGDSKSRQQLKELISISSLLVSHTEIFSGKTPKFFLQKVSLNELLETSYYVIQDKTFSRKSMELFPEKIYLRLDRYYFGEVFRELLRGLFKGSDSISILFDESSLTLTFLHSGKKILPRKVPLLKIVNSKKRENHEVSFQLALKILEISKVKVREETGKLFLIFQDKGKT